MNTSYFARSSKDPRAVSIAGRAPDWFQGREYKKLAPKYWFFQRYKEDHDETAYTEAYHREVLDKLDPATVYEELGGDSVMLCWEAPSKFCHRKLVAEWFKEKLGIDVSEI